MDVLKSKTVTGVAGVYTVSTGGISQAQIMGVHRQGIQLDYVSYVLLSSTSRSWSMTGNPKRLIFNTPFADGGETIFIIYKVTT